MIISMTDSTVVDFPGRRPRQTGLAEGFDAWRAWAECEIAILGYDMKGRSSFGFAVSGKSYDWRAAFERGLAPHEAAEEAAALFEPS
jgi:hypothetical protein